jgi:hypothetical protein
MTITPEISEEQAILSTLSPAMRRALLTATPLWDDPEWDSVADYCEGHESLNGADMGRTVMCEQDPICADAWARYHADRQPDPDRKVVTISADVTIGTVVALIGRGLVEHAVNSRTRDHELTDRGLCVLHALKALPAEQQAPRAEYTRTQRERAYNASKAARYAYRFATEANRVPHAFAEALAAVLDCVATEGDTSPETLRAIARAMKDV